MDKSVLPAFYALVLLTLAVLAHHFVRVYFHDLSKWKGGGMGMFSVQDGSNTRFVSVWLETESGEFIASMRAIGKPLDRYQAEPTFSNLQALCRHLGEAVWIDARRSKSPVYSTESTVPVPVAMVQRVASVEGEALIVYRIRVVGLRLVVDVTSGQMHHQTLGATNYEASTASCGSG